MKLKSLKVLLLTTGIILSLIASVVPATALVTNNQEFSDVTYSSTPYSEAINYFKDLKIINGYSDGTFKPNASINRAEFLKILLSAKGYTGTGENCFTDVKAGKWYTPYVCKAKQLGFIAGYRDGSFKPEQSISFTEASKIIANVLDLSTDPTKTETWYQKFVTALEEKKAIPATVTEFSKKITRGEMAEMAWRIVAKNEDQSSLTYSLLQRVSNPNKSLQTFASCSDMKGYVEGNLALKPNRYMYAEDMLALPSVTTSTSGDSQKAAESSGAEGGAAPADEFSKTNVQVDGVDEADIIKNDGQYIYMVSGETVKIVKAYPPNSMTELDAITFDDTNFYPSELYVDGSTLVVIGNAYNVPDYWIYAKSPEIMPYNGSVTKVYIFDIADRTNIKLSRHVEFEGDYLSSRKISNKVYVVTDKYLYSGYEPIPMFYDSKSSDVAPVTGCTNIMYYPRITESLGYVTVAGISTTDPNAAVSKQVVMGSGENVYASTKNLYVAETKYDSSWRYNLPASDEETTVHKFALSSDIKYLGSGKVPGTILNQFSMDENDNYFRIATTLGNVWDTVTKSTNNLYILDENMKQSGSLTGLAPGEEIYSVRFAGDRAYIVTFKKVDPLFVIDTSDPKLPKVLGKLKIPGYSDYLHPYDENHIIGFGKDATDAGEEEVNSRNLDFAWYQELKIAMFDVTDVNNPKELHKMTIGDRGTSSELLYNHKALLFDKAKGIMAFPVTLALIPDAVKNNPETSASTYGDYVFQGAYVFDVSIANGFKLRGTISHYADSEIKDKSGYYWYGEKDISRIIYIGEYFYTISKQIIQANLMTDLKKTGSIELKNVPNSDTPVLY
jgi:uncharacterized secreted protein with C-terminal beta-propeller domain